MSRLIASSAKINICVSRPTQYDARNGGPPIRTTRIRTTRRTVFMLHKPDLRAPPVFARARLVRRELRRGKPDPPDLPDPPAFARARLVRRELRRASPTHATHATHQTHPTCP